MTTPISSIRNLGPKSEEMFASVGIHSAETLRKLGAVAAYEKIVLAGYRPHFIGFYCIHLGLQDRGWSDFAPGEKEDLRREFDALVDRCSTKKGPSGLEETLNIIGVVAGRQPTSSSPEKK